jgi:hypothetical protein
LKQSITFFLALLSALLCSVTGFQKSAHGYSCGLEPEFTVESAAETHRTLICEAASEAIGFLASYDLHARRPITMEMVDGLMDHRGYVAVGTYDTRTDRIKLMSLDSIQANIENPMMYGEPFDEVHYRGAVAHEVAHAVVHHNMKVKPISPSPGEYIAHATQLAVLPAERREQIIERLDVDSWLPGDAISDIYMAMAPTGFAVKSYLHLTSMNEPADFVTILLNAKWFYVYVPD